MFDIIKTELNRLKYKQQILNSSFYKFTHSDLIERLDPIDRNFKKILLISPIFEDRLFEILNSKFTGCNISIMQISEIAFTGCPAEIAINNKFDLIIFPAGLHRVKEVQFFLKRIYYLLSNSGIFIANFVGGETLNGLRKKFIELETKFLNKHFPRIIPFIDFQHMTPLLQQAGFIENIIDLAPIELEYDSPLMLIRALKNYGETNISNQHVTYSITQDMYKELSNKDPKKFIDKIDLITFISSPSKQSIKLHKEYYAT